MLILSEVFSVGESRVIVYLSIEKSVLYTLISDFTPTDNAEKDDIYITS